MVFSLHQAQRLAEEALAYLGAWDLVRMQRYQAELGALPGYGLNGEVAGLLMGCHFSDDTTPHGLRVRN